MFFAEFCGKRKAALMHPTYLSSDESREIKQAKAVEEPWLLREYGLRRVLVFRVQD